MIEIVRMAFHFVRTLYDVMGDHDRRKGLHTFGVCGRRLGLLV